ncbi:MAG: hypothetical protein KIC68_05245 [Campylobacter concisus]|jgi:hypothetical protein|nr:hypothetical protein [Campylobacter concisus]DAJ59731.1 MAG TPA: hypothetical protein [Caudoviricetes sp.]
MFEKEIKEVVERYISKGWYLEKFRKISIQEDIVKHISEATAYPYEIINNLVKYPELYSEVFDIVEEEFPILNNCISFMRKEKLKALDFTTLLTKENSRMFDEEAEKLKLRIIQEELKPYANKLFNELPLMESRSNALFDAVSKEN